MRNVPRPKTEAELLRFIRDLETFLESARDPNSAADPKAVRKAEERLASLERPPRRLRERRRSPQRLGQVGVRRAAYRRDDERGELEGNKEVKWP